MLLWVKELESSVLAMKSVNFYILQCLYLTYVTVFAGVLFSKLFEH